MRKQNFRPLVAGIALLSTQAFAASIPVSTVQEAQTLLSRGVPVSVAVDLGRCKPADATTPPITVRGGVKIDDYQITPDGTLSFADSHASIDPAGRPVWQFLRYQAKLDQTVAFTSNLYSLPAYDRLAPQAAYTCKVNDGIAFFADF